MDTRVGGPEYHLWGVLGGRGCPMRQGLGPHMGSMSRQAHVWTPGL